MEIDFSSDIIYSPMAQLLAAIALIAAVYLLTWYRKAIASVVKLRREGHALPSGSCRQTPGISVIVYCKDNSTALERMLPALLAQNFEAAYEVIVTVDGRSDRAQDVVTLLSAEHRNLRMTYVPDEAHALSRKKLALTLGIKAARYGYVVLTEANARINSYNWLMLVGRHFAIGKDVVIGTSYPVAEDGGRAGAITMFNMLADKVTYLSSAIAGYPYRASECNMGFRRDLFFGNHSFIESVGYMHGIDDMLLSSIATAGNTAVELAAQSQVGVKCSDLSRDYRADRLSHIFTGRHLSHRQRRVMGLGSAMMWIWLAATVAAGVMLWPNALPLMTAAAAGVVWIVPVTIAWRRASAALNVRVAGWKLPALLFIRPLTTLAARLGSRFNQKNNYTWSRLG